MRLVGLLVTLLWVHVYPTQGYEPLMITQEVHIDDSLRGEVCLVVDGWRTRDNQQITRTSCWNAELGGRVTTRSTSLEWGEYDVWVEMRPSLIHTPHVIVRVLRKD